MFLRILQKIECVSGLQMKEDCEDLVFPKDLGAMAYISRFRKK